VLSDELFDAFREDVADIASPYLWKSSEIWRYMDDAYKMFVRLTGGIADVSSSLTQIDIVTGKPDAEVSPLILKFKEAHLESSGRKIDIVNYTDLPIMGSADYGYFRQMYLNKTPGEVRAVVIGQQRKLVTWVQAPIVDDVAQLSVYRLPLERIVGEGQGFDDIGEEHHEHLLLWMKARAYGKQDAEAFDKGRSDFYKAEFTAYCTMATAEWERAKSKVRSVAYGGL